MALLEIARRERQGPKRGGFDVTNASGVSVYVSVAEAGREVERRELAPGGSWFLERSLRSGRWVFPAVGAGGQRSGPLALRALSASGEPEDWLLAASGSVKRTCRGKGSVAAVFRAFDPSGSGLISVETLSGALKSLGGGAWTDERVSTALAAADANRDGSVDYEEFLAWVWGGDAGRVAYEEAAAEVAAAGPAGGGGEQRAARCGEDRGEGGAAEFSEDGSLDVEVVWPDGAGGQRRLLLRGVEATCTLAELRQRCAVALGVPQVWPSDYSEDMDPLPLGQLGIGSSGLPFAVGLGDGDAAVPAGVGAAPEVVPAAAAASSSSTGRDRRGGTSPLKQAFAEKQALADATDVRDGWLFLGGQAAAGSLSALRRLGVTHVLNCCDRIPCRFAKALTYKVVHVFDTRSSDIRKHFPEALAFLDAARESGGGCLVHCMVGASRSTSIVLAWLVDRGRVPLADAFREVRARRSVARPNRSFCEQLIEFEGAALGVCSATLADFGYT